jgi:hypothetical protein
VRDTFHYYAAQGTKMHAFFYPKIGASIIIVYKPNRPPPTGGGGERYVTLLICREPSGNIQGTFREHSGNIFRGHIQGTYSGDIFRGHSGDMQGTCREHSGNI